jgi:hypothetical protein
VPTFTCGLLRSNFSFDTVYSSQKILFQHSLQIAGAHERDRTADLVLTKDVLYQLSYVGGRSGPRDAYSNFQHEPWTAIALLERVAGIEPASSAWKAEVLPLNYTRQTCRLFALSQLCAL